MRGFTIADAFLCSPQMGVTGPGSTEVHAVEIEGLPLATWDTAEFAAAACGAQVKLVRARWAPRVKGTKFTRCKACEAKCGRKIRSRWATS